MLPTTPQGSPATRRTVVIGLLGTTLDRARGADRWAKWRPTVALTGHDDLRVDRLELLADRGGAGALADTVAADVRTSSPETVVNIHDLTVVDPWDFESMYAALHDFARRYPFDPEAEDYLIHITTGTHVAQICLFLLTESRHLPGRLLQTSPGRAGRGRYSIIDLSLARFDRLARRQEDERKAATSFLKGGIETNNSAFNLLIDRIEQVAARSTAPMLLMGPTGAGKSRLARRIWELKKSRRMLDGGFVEVNCATLRGDGAMSALFGHRRGSFTSAVNDRAGLLREADGGVLFLDEIGELGLDEQAMLLGALEERRFLPVGADKEVRSDFQLLAGTNRDLATQVASGQFRGDLLARIDVWTFRLPGLANRPEDIAPNLAHELERAVVATGQRVTFNREAYARFLAFAQSAPWPRNFRDLGGAVMRMATLAPGGRITEAGVHEEIDRLNETWARLRGDAPSTEHSDPVAEVLGAVAVDRFDHAQLAEVIRVCRQSRSLSAAGRTLFAVSRGQRTSVNDADRLRKYLARFALTWDDVAEARSEGQGRL